jgi:hypothetical protein
VGRNLLLIVGLPLVVSCGGASDGAGGGGLSDIPEIAPLVAQSLPSSLQAPTSLLLAAREDFRTLDTGDDLAVLFKTGSFGKISGGNGNGYINSLLEDLDYRFTELKNRFKDNTPKCFSSTATAHEFDFSHLAGNAGTSVQGALKISLDLQCNDYFDTTNPGEQSGEGSGMLFGKSGDDYSLALLLKSGSESDSGFGYFAKVSNKGTSDEVVDMIFAEGRPVGSTSGGNRSLVSRIKAKPQAGYYEMAIASNQGNRTSPLSGGTVNYSCGFHGITNGTLVYVKGKSGSTCSSATDFESCLSASTLDASSALSDCNTLKGLMTIGSSTEFGAWDHNDVTAGLSDETVTAMQIKTTAIEAITTATKD